jgi:fatty-acyl-CoA synthase
MNVTLPIHQHALRCANKPALIAGTQTLTYAQLDRSIWSAASYFRRVGLVAGDRLAVIISSPLLHMIATLGLARLGSACFVAAADESPADIRAIMQRIEARALICARPMAEFSDIAQFVVEPSSFSAPQRASASLLCHDSDRVLRFLTSSGTTGKPKLFGVSHDVLARRLQRYRFAVPTAASDVFLSAPHIAFPTTFVKSVQALTIGATAVLRPPTASIEDIAGFIAKFHVNRLFAVPSMLRSLVERPATWAALKSLSAIETSTAVVTHSLRERVLEHLTHGLYLNYGTNEAALLTAGGGIALIRTANTVGYPLPGCDVEIVDGEGQEVLPGVVGQVRARHDALIEGYFDDPEATARLFRGGWCYTGDHACWSDDGQLIFKGRVDDMMVFDGINIYPMEIETCLQEHPAVAEAISFPVGSHRFGDVPIAAVRVSAEVTEEALIGFSKERLGARYPRKVLIVDDFPRNAVGKPLKREMAARIRRTLS